MGRSQSHEPGLALFATAAVLAAGLAVSAARAAAVSVTLTGTTLYIKEGTDPALVGTLDPVTGAYTAPPNAGTYHIIAVSNDDPAFTDTTTITVEAIAPTTHTFIWPLPDPPAGNLVRVDDIGPPNIIKDNHGAGDLFALYKEWHGTRRWLLTSQDDGRTWRYLALPPDPTPRGTSDPAADVSAQDSAGDVHHAWVYTGRPNIQYSRVVLTRDAAGHVTGGTWAASNLDGPAVSTAAPGEYRLHLVVARLDLGRAAPGTATECLVLGFVDNPTPAPPYGTGNGYGNYQIAITANLAPTSPASWLRVDGTAAGATMVKSYTSADSHIQDVPVPGQLDPASVVTPIGSTANVHQSTLVLEQHPVDGSIHYFIGPRNTENVKTGLDIRRWRFVPSGAGWVVDPAWTVTDQQFGKLVATTSIYANPNVGAVFKGTSRLWFILYRTTLDACTAAGVTTCENGLVIDAIDANDVYTFNAVPSPASNASWPNMWGGYAVISSDPTDTRLWALWSRFSTGIGIPTDGDWSGYWDGTKWDVHHDAPEQLGGCHAYSGTAAWRGGVAVVAGFKDPTFNNLRIRPYVAAIRTQ